MKNIFGKSTPLAIFIVFLATAAVNNRAIGQAPAAPEPAKISVTGSNGRVASFLGIKTASAKGITVQMVADGPIIGITWDKLDLVKLEEQHPEIYEAYHVATKQAKATDLNLGSFADPNEKKMDLKPKRPINGFYEATSGGIRFVMQMPNGRAKGIIFIAMGDDGESHNMVPRGIPEVGVFGALQKRHKYAIMSYNTAIASKAKPGEVSDFVLPEKRSGEAVLKAITKIAADSGNSSLDTAPIVLYGAGRIGAAFVYNFSQWKPERVVAAVVSNGAFYSQKPTEASAKVPVMFLWGEYNDYAEKWKAPHRREEIQKEYVGLHPNWMDAMEFRGTGYESQLHSYFGLEFLSKMIKKRVPDEPGAEFEELSRSRSWIGNKETFEISARDDAEIPLTENQTWLPDKEFGEMWKAFALGKLELPDPDRN